MIQDPMIAPDHTDRGIDQLLALDGRTAVVTGGARGIGLAIATRLAEAGASVTIADRDGDVAGESARELDARVGGTVTSVVADVLDGATVAAAAEAAYVATGRLDIWVNAAGVYPVIGVLEMDDAFWDGVLDVNLRGSMIGAREGARRMVAAGNGGVIINIASITGFRGGSAGGAAYVASKHGVVGLTKSLAVEFGGQGIRSLGIAPATVLTPGIKDLERQFADLMGDAFIPMMIERVQLGRVAVPDDVARVALFCASDLSSYMTGSTLCVDGGDLAL